MSTRSLAIWAALLVACATGVAQNPSLAPDAVYYNGKVLTVDPNFRVVQAFAVKGDKFVATGSSDEIRALADSHTQMRDMNGRTVVPGLMDNHMHLARNIMLSHGMDPSKAHSLKEFLDMVGRAAASAPGEPIMTRAQGWNPNQWPEKRMPTKADLDRAAPATPVMVRRSRFEAVVNTAAIRKLGITVQTPSPRNGNIVKDPATGEPTGELADEAATQAADRLSAPTREEYVKGLIDLERQQNAVGLTSVREVELTLDQMRAYQEVWEQGGMTVRTSMGLAVFPGEIEQIVDKISPWGVSTGFGDHMLRLDCVGELALDTAPPLTREPVLEPSDRPQRMAGEELKTLMKAINRYGWRPCIHTIGDKGVDLVLDAFEAANQDSSIVGKRWVIEHAYFMFHTDQMERVKKLGVVLSSQPRPYQSYEGDVRMLGKERADHAVPVREWIDHGIMVSGGTDWPSFPNNPFIRLYFFVTRKTERQAVAGPGEKITREEALRLDTINNAYTTFEEKVKGSIEPGKFADFVVLSDDYLTVPEDSIKDIKPVETYLGGVKVYSAP